MCCKLEYKNMGRAVWNMIFSYVLLTNVASAKIRKSQDQADKNPKIGQEIPRSKNQINIGLIQTA